MTILNDQQQVRFLGSKAAERDRVWRQARAWSIAISRYSVLRRERRSAGHRDPSQTLAFSRFANSRGMRRLYDSNEIDRLVSIVHHKLGL